MKKETILKKAIEKAVKNGWNYWQEDGVERSKFWLKILIHTLIEGYNKPHLYSWIFSHNFAKAFWGEGEFKGQGKSKHWHADDLGAFFVGKRWQYHLQQMVLEKDPIKYLEKFVS